MASVFDKLRAALKRPTAPAADWGGAVDAAAVVLATTEQRLEELRTSRREMLTADDGARSAHRLALREAEYDVEDARAYVVELRERQAAAEHAEAETARRTRYSAAVTERDAAAKALKAEYPKLAAGYVKLLRQVAEADALVVAANADLPTGAAMIVGPESQVRDWPALRREDLPSTRRNVWVFKTDGNRVPEGRWDEIFSDSEASFFPTASGRREVVEVIEEERRWLPDEGARYGARLAAVRLPGLRHGDPDFHDGTSGDPAFVLQRSHALADTKPAGRGERQPAYQRTTEPADRLVTAAP